MNQASIPPPIQSLLAERGVVQIDCVPPGFSGAAVYRCRCADESVWALKQWPRDTAAERVDQVHRIICHANRSGCEFVPCPAPWSPSLPDQRFQLTADQVAPERLSGTRRTVAERHWERLPWLPGGPLASDASLRQIQAGAAAISRFHHAVANLGAQAHVAPAVVARLKRLEELQQVIPRLAPEVVPDGGPIPRSLLQAGCQLVNREWPQVGKRLTETLGRHAQQSTWTQYVLRDVHREHLYFQKNQVSGLIDFDAIRIDTPLTDLARWGTEFVIESQSPNAVWESVMAGWREGWSSEGRVVIRDDFRLMQDLYRASIWISLANWLDWILIQHRRFSAEPEKIAARVRLLVRGAEKEIS
ncbi:MAG: phosphotransferase [Planctomycetaceae bacterium]|nr:phosphotransferase [Planctomycetaceae bacterium]